MRYTFLLFLLLAVAVSSAQTKYALKIVGTDKPSDFFEKKFAYKSMLRDSMVAVQEMNLLLSKLRNAGYLAASTDSIQADSASMYTYIYVGEPFSQIVLTSGNLDVEQLQASGAKNSIQNNKPISYRQVEQIKSRVIQSAENSGYPFASVRLDSFQYGENISAKLMLTKNDLIKYDTLRIFGKTKVKRVFLKNYLGLKTNRAYNESNISRIKQRLNELQFVEQIQPHTVEFQNGKAAVNLYLKDKRASQFNFLLGFLPGSSGQKLLVTGEARIHLFSPFGVGEEIFLEWQKLQPKTQRLDIRLTYPYIAGLPLGINARFELYKRDTTYLDIDGDYGVQYQTIGSNYLRASLKQKTTILLNPDTAFVRQRRALPTNLDINSNEFALEYFVQKLDYRFNPTSGYVLRLGGSAGVKRIRKNNTIASMFDEIAGKSFEYLYDSIRTKSFQFKIALAFDKYWRLAPRHTIKTAIDGKYFYSPLVFENEMYRLGGVSSLRGFDDQSIFTPYYLMANLEYRFLLSKNSYFSAFFNSAMVKNNAANQKQFDFPYGFGAGAAIETKAGIFGITYAMGTQQNNKISFRSAKIHFGYVNYF
jgi:outer membrane protein assembly factor BamA